ncbi:O-unit flippase-like protein [Tannerella sp.]|uniref:O-unit flippase-like protein n=1 Tax=Tannerella sp. TaxID=2382127 RepID=UPI0026DAF48B|nr:O-unit flippase-like protein [Tannerella sp.]MDO4702722.1 O-unit flippase-like protein [Tannerella sp.]
MENRIKLVSISKKDILWSYLSQFLSIGAGILILPAILHKLSSQEIAINYILLSISAFIPLLDAGFSPQFTRNITYVFNGANVLKKEGYDHMHTGENINYRLLSSVIRATQYTYKRFALGLGLLLLSVGTWYMHIVTDGFSTVSNMLWIWVLFCLSVLCTIYLLYYHSLLIGRGFIKESQKAYVFTKVLNMCIAIGLVYCNLGLISIAVANLLAPVIGRLLAHFYFYRDGLKEKIQDDISFSEIKSVLSVSWPNVRKLSLITIAGYVVSQLGMFLSGLYLPLEEVASYGLMIQLSNVVVIVSSTLITIQTPAFASYRVTGDREGLIKKFASSMVLFYPLFIVGAVLLVWVAPKLLSVIQSNAVLPASYILITYCLIRLLEANHSCFANIISSANHIPFFHAALLSGLCTLIGYGLLILCSRTSILFFILVPGVVQLVYQNWKWPQVVLKEFGVNWMQFIRIGHREACRSFFSFHA